MSIAMSSNFVGWRNIPITLTDGFWFVGLNEYKCVGVLKRKS